MKKTTETKIDRYRQLLHDILGRFALNWDGERETDSFEVGTMKYFGFENEFGWNILMNALYVFDDTEMAKESFRKFRFGEFTSYQDVGERYLLLYGFLNSCYQQKNAIENLIEVFKLPNKVKYKEQLSSTQMIELRNKIGAHPSNYLNNDDTNQRFNVYEVSRSDLSLGKIELLKNQDVFESYNLNEIQNEFDNIIETIFYLILSKFVKKKFNNQGKVFTKLQIIANK
ncbi:MAG: hypothetical protein ACFHU9_07710 [Fluviicola sp.]